MSWTTAKDDLRSLLSDGPTDKLRSFKRVLGKLDGTNIRFKTFEFRRVSNFTTATDPVGIYKNDVYQGPSSVASDDISTGFFKLTTAPVDGDVLEACYYLQWFTDAELDEFMRISSNWINSADDYTTIIPGLRPGALMYAAGEAYQKLALRWSEHMSDTYRLEDLPDKDTRTPMDVYARMSKDFRDRATAFRDDFYTRQGRSKQPISARVSGAVRDVAPSK